MSLFPGNAGTYLHGNYGYPYRGSARRLRPTVLAVVHITGNSRLPSAMAEAQYSARAGSGASFTFVVNRNGTVVQCLHPETQTPWTNGDLRSPIHPVTRAMVGSPYNANEYCFLTVENVGYNPGSPITEAQINAVAEMIAWGSKVAKLPVNRITVLGHRDINSISRWNCPTPGDLNAFLDRIIDKANRILNPPEDKIMALVPVELFPAGTKVTFTADTTYKFYRIADGKLERKDWTASSNTGALAGAYVALDGDVEHKGVYVLNGIHAGWVVSGWGPAPGIVEPADPTADLKAQISALNTRLSKKDVVFDSIKRTVATKVASGKAI